MPRFALSLHPALALAVAASIAPIPIAAQNVPKRPELDPRVADAHGRLALLEANPAPATHQ